MARRRRLSVPDPTHDDTGAAARPAPRPAAPGVPIARVAGEAASAGALDELSREMEAARREGRLVRRLPVAAIEAEYLIRDRLLAEDEAFTALLDSLRARGQQVPIEVTELGEGRYGLISGWRRLRALARLHEETGEARFAEVLAVLRSPAAGADAYLAMVEENEIRAGLSYYERARILARTVEAGVFTDTGTALKTLFAAASKAKRSKISAFLRIHQELGGTLAFPAALAERPGLELARALGNPDMPRALRRALAAAAPDSAEVEQAVLRRVIEAGTAPPPAPAPRPGRPKAERVEPAPGIRLSVNRTGLTLTGPGVDAAFRARLEAWLATQG